MRKVGEAVGLVEKPVWFITGSATGLGCAVAEAALERGDRVVMSARNAADRLEDLTSRYPDTCRAAELDVTDRGQAEAAMRSAVAAFGRVDVLLNNAGVNQGSTLEDISEEQLRDIMETNLFGSLNVTRAFLPMLREQRSGHVLFTSSLAGRTANHGYAVYAASKFGLAGVAEALRAEMKPFGVHVTCIFPATYQTPLNSRMRKHEPTEPYKAVYDFLRQGEEMTDKLPDAHNLEGYARAVLEVVNSRYPPGKINIGSGGNKNIRKKLQDEIEELDEWEVVSNYTDAT